MNWYNEIKLNQKVTEKSPAYTSIGHGNDTPNIIWVFWEGEIKTFTEEINVATSHTLVFPEVSGWGSIYYGRYETSTEKCSIQKPNEGSQAYKDIPSILIRRLDSTFNNPIYKIF